SRRRGARAGGGGGPPRPPGCPPASPAGRPPLGVPLVPRDVERVQGLGDRAACLEVRAQLAPAHLAGRRPAAVAPGVAGEISDRVATARLARQPLDEGHAASLYARAAFSESTLARVVSSNPAVSSAMWRPEFGHSVTLCG